MEDSVVVKEILFALRRIFRAMDLHSKKLTQFNGFTVPQIIVLNEIIDKESVSVGDVAQKVNLSGATITSILDRLEKRGYVNRYRSEDDKRRVIVEMTEKGTEVTKSLPSIMDNEFTERFLQLEDWEQSLIISSVQRLANLMEDDYNVEDNGGNSRPE